MSSYPEAIEIAAELERRYGSDPLDPAADPRPCIELSAARLLRVLYTEIERPRADAERYRELLQRIVESVSEPTFDDVRLDYIEVQIDRDAVAALAVARTALEGER